MVACGPDLLSIPLSHCAYAPSTGGGPDLLSAGSGNETLLGLGTGADTFIGGSGQDMITGGEGNNTIVAGTGADTLTGGPSGNDYEFINGQAGGNVLITDYMNGLDQLTLLGYHNNALQRKRNSKGSNMFLPHRKITETLSCTTLPDNSLRCKGMRIDRACEALVV